MTGSTFYSRERERFNFAHAVGKGVAKEGTGSDGELYYRLIESSR